MNSMAVGVDIAKNVFQVHYVDQATGEIVNRPLKRAKFLEHFANRAACLIGMGSMSASEQERRLGPAEVLPDSRIPALGLRHGNRQKAQHGKV